MPFHPLPAAAACTFLLAAALSGQSTEDPTAPMFRRDHVLDIRIVMSPADWHDVRVSRRHAEDEELTRLSEDAYEYRPGELWIDGEYVGRVGVRKKGFIGSSVSTRPSLKVKLDEYVRGQSFSGMDGLTLNNNIQDATLVQQHLAFDFFARAGIPASRTSFARVEVNGEDLGVYTHIEAVGRPFLRRIFGDASGPLYEGFAGDFSERLPRIVEKRDGTPEAWQKFEELTALLAVDGPVSIEAIGRIVDLDSFLRLWAAESLIGHWDGYAGNRNNFYVYVHPATGLVHFIPWGADQVFINRPGSGDTQLPVSFLARGHLCLRLWELPEVRARYQAALRELLAGAWNEERMLADVVELQQVALPFSALTPGMVDSASQRIRTFVEFRRAEVEAELNGPVPQWPATPPPATPQLPMTITGTFTAPWLEAAPESAAGTGAVELVVRMDGVEGEPADSASAFVTTLAPPNSRAGYHSLVLMTHSQGRSWRLVFTIDPYLFAAGRMPVDHFGVRTAVRLTEGDAPSRNRMLGVVGELLIDETGAEPGTAMRGSFSIRLISP
jgi:hypothetical protein